MSKRKADEPAPEAAPAEKKSKPEEVRDTDPLGTYIAFVDVNDLQEDDGVEFAECASGPNEGQIQVVKGRRQAYIRAIELMTNHVLGSDVKVAGVGQTTNWREKMSMLQLEIALGSLNEEGTNDKLKGGEKVVRGLVRRCVLPPCPDCNARSL